MRSCFFQCFGKSILIVIELVQRRKMGNHNIPDIDIQPSARLAKPAKPRSRFSKLTPTRLFIIIPTVLAVILLVCTIYLLATRKARNSVTTVAPKVEEVELADLNTTAPGFYPDKIENKSEDTIYTLLYNESGNLAENPLSISLLTNNTGINIDVNWAIAKDYYSVNIARSGTETFTITTEIPIADLAVLKTLDHAKDSIILLMADGTVEHIPISASLQNRAFISRGKIADLTNIVKFYRVSTGAEDTILVQKASGELFDISKLL